MSQGNLRLRVAVSISAMTGDFQIVVVSMLMYFCS